MYDEALANVITKLRAMETKVDEQEKEIKSLRAKLADADMRNKELVEASTKLLNDAKAWKKMSASMGVVESIVAKHKASMEGE